MELLDELNSPHIQEIRGKGLLVGVQLDTGVAPLVNKAYEKGVILVSAGANVLRFVPPLVITRQEIERAVQVVGEILQEM
jgi:acetylornithine/succinyldiaminopimelate/putrescine aminotransferase